MPIVGCIVLLCSLIFVVVMVLLFIRREEVDYNHGICPHCERKLRKFDEDSQGGRGYMCDCCGYVTWVSYYCVDRDYKEDDHD
jgi:hypothetical protein